MAPPAWNRSALGSPSATCGVSAKKSKAPCPNVAPSEEIKVGLISILEGNFAVSGTDAIRGAELAIKDVGGSVDGNTIELITMSSDGSPDTAVNAARKLIEQDGVDIILGPLNGSEGLALRDLSKSYPAVTFINGSSAAQDTTLREPSDNFFRFGGDGAQWMVGVGDYAFSEMGYRSVAIVAEDYSFPYTQVLGFMSEFCAAEGTVPEKFWTPIGNKDYSSVVYAIPQDVDAIFVSLGGADAVNFLTQYSQAGGDKPIIGGSVTIDQSILESKGPFKKLLVGAPAGTPTVGDYEGAEWQAFVQKYTAILVIGCQGANNRCWRLAGRCCSTPNSWCWMNRPKGWPRPLCRM